MGGTVKEGGEQSDVMRISSRQNFRPIAALPKQKGFGAVGAIQLSRDHKSNLHAVNIHMARLAATDSLRAQTPGITRKQEPREGDLRPIMSRVNTD